MKYKNKRTTITMYGETHVFDSKAEAKRGYELIMLNKAGEITGLEMQPSFILQAAFRRQGKKHREIKYIADFKYVENGKTIVEDVKSKITATPLYQAKKKLFLYRHGDNIIFQEVYVEKGQCVLKII